MPQISLQEILLKQIVIAREIGLLGTPDSYNRLYNINRQKEQ